MHPFGGTPICPKCSKAVYAAEQVLGPGRKLYHKPCMACTTCNKRLDSFSLVEHDQEPYCKNCHVKNFGTRDLRQANLPQRPASSPPLSPTRTGNGFPQRSIGTTSPPPRVPSPVRTAMIRNGFPPRLQPNRTLSPTSPSFPRSNGARLAMAESPLPVDDFEAEEAQDTLPDNLRSRSRPTSIDLTGVASNRTGISQIVGDDDVAAVAAMQKFNSVTLGRSNSSATASMMEKLNKPIMQTSTGTRYGAALGAGVGLGGRGVTTNVTGTSPNKWGGNTPSCPKCGKSVYFAEQVKAVGKTYHKGCLRCDECNTLLDSTRLRDHEGTPLCSRCYSKLHGPQGSGYALLGKAGG